MIHGTAVQEPVRMKGDEIKERCRDLIKYRIGRENAITSGEIADKIGIRSTATNQKIRKAMKELLCEECLPVVSCQKGFFYAKEPGEIKAFRTELINRTIGINRDVQALNKLIGDDGTQTELF